ncbi:MAG: YfhO family protein [bacterium]|nr:YfhO family protein [bacterium]MDD5756399.1 YfhO family protein [bacterium]
MKLNRKDTASLVLFLVIFGLFFQANIIGQKMFCFRDIGRYYYPSRFFVAESLHQGSFPFWNPYIFCGYPSFASLQQATLYPVSLLYCLFPFFKGFNWFFLVHFLIAGTGLYFLMRRLSLSRLASLCGSICFAFNSYLVSMLNLLTTLSAVVWMPFLFLFFQRFMQSRCVFWLVPASLVLCLQFLSGQPEITFLTFLVASIYAVYHSWSCKEWGSVRLGLQGLLIMAVLALGIAGVQIGPFLEIIKNSARETTSAIRNTVWSFHPLEIINFVIPSFSSDLMAGSSSWFGQAWMRSGYLGIIVLVSAAFSLLHSYRIKIFFWSLVSLGLLLSLGQYLPWLEANYKYLPVFNLIRYPVKYIALFYFSLAVLVGLGVEEFFSHDHWRKSQAYFIILLGLLSVTFIILWRIQPQIVSALEKYFTAGLAPLEKSIFYNKVPLLFRDWLWMIGWLALLMVVLFLRSAGVVSSKMMKKLFLGIFTLSLLSVNYGAEPVAEQYFYTVPTVNARFLQGKTGYERIYLTPKSSSTAVKNLTVYPKVDFREDFYKRQKAILPNLQAVHHFFSIDGYESIKLKNNEHLINLLSSRPMPQVAKYLDLLGVKYLLSFYPVEGERWSKVRDDYIMFFENRKVRDRIQFFNQAECLSQPAEIDCLLEQASFDPTQVLLLTGAKGFCPVSFQEVTTPPAKGQILSYTGNRVEIQATASQDVWLLLTDTYYPGWQVRINNQPATIQQADYMLRAVRLPAGENSIIFSFLPSWFWISLLSTLAALLVLSFCALSKVRRFILMSQRAEHEPIS